MTRLSETTDRSAWTRGSGTELERRRGRGVQEPARGGRRELALLEHPNRPDHVALHGVFARVMVLEQGHEFGVLDFGLGQVDGELDDDPPVLPGGLPKQAQAGPGRGRVGGEVQRLGGERELPDCPEAREGLFARVGRHVPDGDPAGRGPRVVHGRELCVGRAEGQPADEELWQRGPSGVQVADDRIGPVGPEELDWLADERVVRDRAAVGPDDRRHLGAVERYARVAVVVPCTPQVDEEPPGNRVPRHHARGEPRVCLGVGHRGEARPQRHVHRIDVDDDVVVVARAGVEAALALEVDARVREYAHGDFRIGTSLSSDVTPAGTGSAADRLGETWTSRIRPVASVEPLLPWVARMPP